MVIRWRKIRRVRRMLKDLPFEFLKCGFHDLCCMGPSVVVKDNGLPFSIRSLQLICLIYAVQLGNVEFLVNRTVLLEHLPEHQTLPFPSNADHGLLWVEFLLDSRLRRISWSHHSFRCIIMTYRHHFSSPVTILYRNRCLWPRIAWCRARC